MNADIGLDRYDTVVYGDDLAIVVAGRLAGGSISFRFDPYPDGYYLFSVKPEARSELHRFIREFETES